MENKIEKTALDKAIEFKAKERVNKHYDDFLNQCRNNPVARMLQVKCADGEFRILSDPNEDQIFGKGNVFLNENTNFKEVEKHLLKQYMEEETKDILTKLNSISYLFNQ